jgi:orotate phosphoribosyltransferase
MINDISYFLEDNNCFKFQEINLISHKIYSPYLFQTPRPINSFQLDAIGKKSFNIIKEESKRRIIHIIAIATSGISIATAIVNYLHQNNINCYLSILKPTGEDINSIIKIEKTFCVLIDNSIKSSNTLLNSISILRNKDIEINLILFLYDYSVKNKENIDVIQAISKKLNIKIKTIFSVIDLLKYYEIKDKKKFDILQEYLFCNGNENVSEYLKI